MVGAGLVAVGHRGIKDEGVEKVVTALIVSPFLGFFAAFVTTVAMYWIVRRMRPARINSVFRRLQLLSSAFMAFSHGTNDAQKTMGVITMALVSCLASTDPDVRSMGATLLGDAADAQADGKFPVPLWVVVSCAIAMGFGTAMGGWRIIHTMGQKIFKLRPIHGFCAETSAALVLQVAAAYGLPASTTHCITSAIMGAGATTRLSAVSWGVTRRILGAWVLTIPACAGTAAAMYALFERLGF
jgi:PiT family inorganic phosphate transporter